MGNLDTIRAATTGLGVAPMAAPAGRPGGAQPPAPGALVVEPSPQIAVSLAALDALQARRKVLLHRKRRRRILLRKLDQDRPPVWRVGSETRLYKGNLGAIEMRDETALVDQHALVEHLYDHRDLLVEEHIDIRTENVRDQRVWSRVIRGERVFVRRFVAPQERLVRRLLTAQRHARERTTRWLRDVRGRVPAAGWPMTAVLFLPLLLFAALIRLTDFVFLGAVVGGQRKIARTAVDAPVSIRGGYRVTRQELASEEGRRLLRGAVFSQRLLTPERRTTLLFLASVVLAVTYIVAELVIRAAFPDLVDAKRQVDIVFFYSIATRIVLPTPFEILLPAAAQVVGYWPTILVTALGGVVGSWLLFLIGAEATEGLYKLGDTRPWLKRGLDWCGHVGPRHGYWILFLVMAIPFSLDSVAAVAALFRLRLGPFLWTIFFSTVLRAIIFLQFFD